MSSQKVPEHIAIVMDGNGRWARQKGKPRPFGHQHGATTTRNIIDASIRHGVKYLTLYVFSAENWQRPPTEVKLLMTLLVEMIKKELKNLQERDVQVVALGDLSKLPPKAKAALDDSIEKTANNKGLVLQLAISYGGRAEIVHAAQQMIRDGVDPETITEESFSSYLYNPTAPDPELIIRTGGDQRISNFLLWEAAYSELYFTDTLWPDFNEDGFLEAIAAYNNRERRFGKVLSE